MNQPKVLNISEKYAYQDETVLKLHKFILSNKKRVLVCSPTGSGKTVIMGKLIKFIKDSIESINQINPNAKILVLTHRQELYDSSHKTFYDMFGIITNGINSKTKKINPLGKVFVAMVQSLKSRIHLLPQFDIVIIDECHRREGDIILGVDKDGFSERANAWFKTAKVIGFTATPVRDDLKNPLKNYYDDIIVVGDTPDMLERGSLVPPIHIVFDVDQSLLKFDKFKNDFTEKSQLDALVANNPVEEYRRHAEKTHPKMIVFCVNAEKTIETYNQFKAEGYDVYYALSDEKKNDLSRKEAFNQFKKSKKGILINCGIATTGFDDPTIQAVMLLFITSSLTKLLQCVGRGSRLCNSIGKKDFMVFDFGANYRMHGYWEDKRDWTDLFWNPKRFTPSDGEAQKKICPSCKTHIAIQVIRCPKCDHYFKPKVKEQVYVDFYKVTQEEKKQEIDRVTHIMIENCSKNQDNNVFIALLLHCCKKENFSAVISEYEKRTNRTLPLSIKRKLLRNY